MEREEERLKETQSVWVERLTWSGRLGKHFSRYSTINNSRMHTVRHKTLVSVSNPWRRTLRVQLSLHELAKRVPLYVSLCSSDPCGPFPMPTSLDKDVSRSTWLCLRWWMKRMGLSTTTRVWLMVILSYVMSMSINNTSDRTLIYYKVYREGFRRSRRMGECGQY